MASNSRSPHQTRRKLLPPSHVVSQPQPQHQPEDIQTEIFKIQMHILYELRELNAFNQKIANQPPIKAQEVLNAVLQIFGLIGVVLFGVFAILGWRVADKSNHFSASANDLASTANGLAFTANEQALTANSFANVAIVQASAANKLALLGQCQGVSSGVCTAVQAYATSSLDEYALAYYGITAAPASTSHSGNVSTTTASTLTSTYTTSVLPPALSSPPEASPTAGYSGRTGAIAGGVAGSVAVLLVVGGVMFATRRTYHSKLERSQALSKEWPNAASREQPSTLLMERNLDPYSNPYEQSADITSRSAPPLPDR